MRHGDGRAVVNLSLRLLRAFVVVSDEGHVGRAAARLFVSQPSLSQDIRRLEREAGVTLFDRGPKGLTLTAPGEVLLRSVEAALIVLDHGIADAQDLAAGGRSTVRIAYSPSLGNEFIPALIPLLERHVAALDVEEHELDTGQVGPAVASGKFDIGFAHCPSPDPQLLATHLVDEPLCVALAKGHSLARQQSVRLSELSDSSLLIWPRDTAPEYYDAILSICRQAGLGLRSVKEFRRITPRSYLLDDKQTFSLLPKSAASLPRPEVTFVQIEDSEWTIPLMFLRRAEDNRTELNLIESLARSTSQTLSASS
ncbi:LysR substrate-binding domain-containing protein [soil metagenome]